MLRCKRGKDLMKTSEQRKEIARKLIGGIEPELTGAIRKALDESVPQ